MMSTVLGQRGVLKHGRYRARRRQAAQGYVGERVDCHASEGGRAEQRRKDGSQHRQLDRIGTDL